MIVTAIIALIAAIAIPGYVRSRKRGQATAILNDARVIGSAMDQYAIENNKKGDDTITATNMKAFFKPASRMYVEASRGPTLSDQLGNNYSFNTFDRGVHVNTGTVTNFADIIENATSFWGSYY